MRRMLGRYIGCAVVAACAVLQACSPAGPPERSAEATTAPPTKRPADDRARMRLDGGVVYDRFCARRDPPPGPLLAAYDGRRVVVHDDDGEIARIPGRPPVRWSSSGALLAVGPRGALWTWEGHRYEGADVPLELTSSRGASWAWSPNGDCALVLDEGRLGAFHTGAGANSTTILNDGVEAAAWGPRGKVAVVLRDGARPSLWMADLRTSRARRVSVFEHDTCCVVLGGWSPDGNEILYWAGPGTSVMQDGWPLQSVTRSGRTRTWGRTLPRPDVIAPCRDGVVALTGGDRSLERNRVSLLDAQASPMPLTKRGAFEGAACSPDGSSVVVATGGGLDLLRVNGSERIAVTGHPRASDLRPEWGRASAGVLFLRRTGSVGKLLLLWEGTRPRFAATLVAPPRQPPDLAYDWTATRPLGLLPPP